MNDIVIESFITYCDDMMIPANESSGICKKIMVSIHNLIRKILTWLKNMLFNINHFKTAMLPEMMNKDLIKVLQISQSRLEGNFKILNRFFSLFKNNEKKRSQKGIQGMVFGVYKTSFMGTQIGTTDLDQEIDKCVAEIDDSLEAGRSCKEFKRLEEGNYTDKEQQIPLSNIIPDMKKSQTGATEMKNYIDKMDAYISKLDKPNGTVFSMLGFVRKSLQYYNFRISILNKYFEKAKASLSALKMNMQEKKMGDNKPRINTKNGWLKKKIIIVNAQKGKKIEKLYDICRKATSYSEYKQAFNSLSKIFGLSNDIIHGVTVSTGYATIMYVKDHRKKSSVEGRTLYHSSFERGLTSLTPKFRANGGAMFPTPRVYVHIGVSLDRFGARGKEADLKSGTRYIITDKINTVYVDPEMGRTAAYIETMKAVHVKPDFS